MQIYDVAKGRWGQFGPEWPQAGAMCPAYVEHGPSPGPSSEEWPRVAPARGHLEEGGPEWPRPGAT